MKLDTLKEVETEVKRFMKKLDAAKKRIQDDGNIYYATKENGAVKRAALDLKVELTKITQSRY